MEFKTQSDYFSRMMNTLRSRSGHPLGEHSEPALRLRALASELEALGAEAAWIWRQSFPQTADGERLEQHAALRGLTRTRGGCAGGDVRFFTDGGGEVTVPAGTEVCDSSLRRYRTAAELVIPAGDSFGDVRCEALEPGTEGNAPAGEICVMPQPVAGVISCVNPDAFSGGTADEDDESLRSRIIEAYRMPIGGANAAYYSRLALSVPGVTAVQIYPRAAGKGSVGVYVANEEGPVSAETKAAVSKLLNAQREISNSVLVLEPSVRMCYPEFNIAVHAGADTAAIREAALQHLRKKVFGGHTLGKTVYISEMVIALNEIPGIVSAYPRYSINDFGASMGTLTKIGNLYTNFREV